MSYILDALRKVEPDLGDNELSPRAAVPPSFARPQSQGLWYLALAIAVLAVAISVLALWRSNLTAAPLPPATLAPATPQPASAEPPATTAKPAVVVVGRVAPAVHEPLDWPPRSREEETNNDSPAIELPLSLSDVQLAGASLEEHLPDFSAEASAQPAQQGRSTLPAVEKVEAQPLTGELLAQQFAAAVAATAPAQQQQVAPLAEQPAAIQQRVPPLSFSQHLYSSDARSRWVRVNGRDAREGDKIGPELVIERIEPQQVVLSLAGYRFTLPALGDWR